jgi:hypothetical protein
MLLFRRQPRHLVGRNRDDLVQQWTTGLRRVPPFPKTRRRPPLTQAPARILRRLFIPSPRFLRLSVMWALRAHRLRAWFRIPLLPKK